MTVTSAYAAGIIDGEGCITISGNDSRAYSVRVDVGMTDKAIALLKRLKAQYGGTVSRHRKQSEKWESASRWTLCGSQAAKFLSEIEQHLVLKKEQAAIAQRLQAMIDNLPWLRKGAKQWDAESRQAAKTAQARVQELNRKGPNTPIPKGGFARLVGEQWMTDQADMFEPAGLQPFAGRWPRSGMTVNGIAYRLPPLVPRISGTGCSSLPTPTAGDAKSTANATANRKPDSKHHTGTTLTDFARMWPTPTTSDGTRGGKITANMTGTSLPQFVNSMLPTPTARDYKDNGRSPAELSRNSETLAMHAGGSLNPQWVEWLMGFDIGWTDLEDLETQ